MMTAPHHQSKLYEALGDAIEDAETPGLMTPTKEAVALAVIARQVVALLSQGECPVVKLMVLSQQALRCAAVACAQGDVGAQVASDIIARALPS